MFQHKTYSGLANDRLVELLRAIRNFAGQSDETALSELDKLLAGLKRELSSGDEDPMLSWGRKQALDGLARLRESIERVRAGMVEGGQQLLWNAQFLRDSAERADDYLDASVKTAFLPEFQALQREAKSVAAEAEVLAHSHALREAAVQLIHNASSVRSIIAAVDESIGFLSQKGRFPPDLQGLGRSAKERAARFRAQKKLDDADVASAGGNEKKADKLRREATVLLAQDWVQAFPGEQPPVR